MIEAYMDDPKEGWFMLSNARKMHYFKMTKSLRGRWMYLGTGPFEADNGIARPLDCILCRRVLEMLQATLKNG